MDELIKILNNIPDSYYEFTDSVAAYARKKPAHLFTLLHYLNDHENLSTSDVLEFMMDQDDFFDDDVSRNVNFG